MERVRLLYSQGLRQKDIAPLVGVCVATLVVRMKESGIATRSHLERFPEKRNRPEVLVSQLVEGYNRGLTLTELALEYQTPEETVRRWLHERGVCMRPRSFWVPGSRPTGKGKYKMVKQADNPKAHKGMMREHDVVMEAHIGRGLRLDEQVHHKNGLKWDNRLENLELVDVSDHTRLHAAECKALRLSSASKAPCQSE